MSRLRVPFVLRGSDGEVLVDVRAAEEPSQSGLHLLSADLPADAGVGLPMCTATVTYAGTGYAAAMGWVQLVACDSGTGEGAAFEPDPLALLRSSNSPYAFFGICPTLFDAPYRPLTEDLRWRARSYLAVTTDAVLSREAHAIAAFTWGFDIVAGAPRIAEPSLLDVATWQDHTETLRRSYPGWTFS